MFPTLRNWVFCLPRLFKVVRDSHHKKKKKKNKKKRENSPLSDLFSIKWVPEVIRSASVQQKEVYTIMYPQNISSLTCIIT
jgi:glycerol-3-phosphate cytidylyltransferase-like family protein